MVIGALQLFDTHKKYIYIVTLGVNQKKKPYYHTKKEYPAILMSYRSIHIKLSNGY